MDGDTWNYLTTADPAAVIFHGLESEEGRKLNMLPHFGSHYDHEQNREKMEWFCNPYFQEHPV